MKRRTLLASAGVTVVGGLLPPQQRTGQRTTMDGSAEWLASLLWQRQARELDASLVPPRLVPLLKAHPHVIFDLAGSYRFTDPALIDALVAHRIFGDLHAGSSLASAGPKLSHWP